MGFLPCLPMYDGKNVIMVAPYQLTLYAHFCSIFHPFKLSTWSMAFMETIYNLYGKPNIIMSDRDPIFIGNFSNNLFSCVGPQLDHKASYHP